MRNIILSALLLASAFQTALGEQAGDWTYAVENNQVAIIGYTGAGGAVTIPSEINGIPVVKVGNNESWQQIFGPNNYFVTSITIPNSVTSIGNYALSNCYALKYVTIGNSLTSIGNYAFSNCSALTNITIPNSLTSIGEYAFYSCTVLTSITIPNSVTSIGPNAFYNCTGLTSITIPNRLTSIGYNTFYNCTGLTSITIPNSVTSIGSYAFGYCNNLSTVTIQGNVTSIGDRAFEGCPLNFASGFRFLVVGSGIFLSEYIGYDSIVNIPSVINGLPVISIGSACQSKYMLKSVTVPNSVTSIGQYAFQNCGSLISITIPNSVTSIGDYAFYGCNSLTSIAIPSSVTSIGSAAFRYCGQMTTIEVDILNTKYASPDGVLYNKDKTELILYPPNRRASEFLIPNGVEKIDSFAFSGCCNLKSITIPDSVTSIEECAFTEISSLRSIIIPSSVTSVGTSAFSYCPQLTAINIPSSVTSLGDSVFSYCTQLTTINIPSSVKTIGSYAFYNTGVTDLYIPDNVVSIGIGAFSSNSLKSISIPEKFSNYIFTYTYNPENRSFPPLSSLTIRDKGMQYLYPEFLDSLALNTRFIDALANNDSFVTAVANKIKGTFGTYGLATQSELGTLATKSELTSAITESRTAGVNSVLSNPNLWTLYTTSQIQNMAMGDLVLTKQVNGKFALNYDIEQSEDLKTWTTYRALYLPLNGLPTDKAFVRIKMINSSSNPSAATPVGGNIY